MCYINTIASVYTNVIDMSTSHKREVLEECPLLGANKGDKPVGFERKDSSDSQAH